jgi:DNA mismatch repair protein MutL
MLEIVEELSQVEKIDFSPTGKVIAAIACKLALKAGTKLQDSQIKNIINDFSKLQKPYSCPHGRPFVIKITKEEIERRFNRR